MKTTHILLILFVTLLISGCTPVQPWEKENFAKKHMSFDPNILDRRFIDHVHESREGSRGGRGLAAGGCGCN